MKKKMLSMLLLTALVLVLLPIVKPQGKAGPQDTTASDVRIMSANMLAEFPTWWGSVTPEPTNVRVVQFEKLLNENNPIAVGTQEMSPTWYTAFQQLDSTKWGWLTESDVAGYSYYNYVPNKGLALNSILYRKDLLTLQGSGVEAYTQRTNGHCIVWGVFTVNATGKQFVLISTHWTPDRPGDKSAERLAQAEQLAKKVNDLRLVYGDTIICTGDFNCNDESQEFRRFLALSNSVDSRTGAATRGDSYNKIDHVTATADGTFSYHTVCYEANGAYKISDHPFVVGDIKLTTNLYFDFTDTAYSRPHYKQGAYRYNAYDYHTAYWKHDSNRVSDLTINKTDGTLSFNITADGNPYVFTDTKSATELKNAYGLNFETKEATHGYIRFRLFNSELIDTSKSPSLTLSAVNRTTGKTASIKKSFTLSQISSSYLTLFFDLTQSSFHNLGRIDSFQLSFDNVKNGSAKIAYIYLGVYNYSPQNYAMLFDFSNTAEDQARYKGAFYGGYQFDKASQGHWATYETSTTSDTVYTDFAIDNSAGTLSVKVAQGVAYNSLNGKYGPWITTAKTYGSYPWYDAGSLHPLQYAPKNAECVQIRFKTIDCEVAGASKPQVVVVYDYDTGSGTARGEYTMTASYTLKNDTYQILTIPVSEQFKTSKKITNFGFRFWHLKGTSENAKVVIDVIYVGPEAALPNRHVYDHKTVAPTCTAGGYSVHTCRTCAYSYRDSITNAKEHSYYYDYSIIPTNHNEGQLIGTCTDCSATTTVTMPKLNTTDYTKTVVAAPTCTENGTDKYTWKVTTYGTRSINTNSAPLGHDYINYEVATTPTISASGTIIGTCSRCTVTKTVTLPKLNTTDYTMTVTKAATCTATGTDTYKWKTTTYGEFTFQISRNPIGHKYDSGVVTTKPTFTAKGVKTFTCQNDASHTYTESVDVLHKALFFDFDNGAVAKERYNNYVYNFLNFDQIGAWRGRTTGYTDGSQSMDTAAGTLTVQPGKTGFTSIYADSVNFDLNYDPDYADYFQMRFKATGLDGTGGKARIYFYYSTDNSNRAGNAVSFDAEFLSSGEYVLVTGALQDAVRSLTEVNRVAIQLSAFAAATDLNATVTFDYAYVGPYETLPNKGDLYFGFGNTAADQTRYHTRAYGYTQFDHASEKNWFFKTDRVSDFTIDNSAGTMILKANPSLPETYWPDVYVDTNIGSTGTKYPLEFHPDETEYFQVRFKMKNFKVGDQVVTNDDGTTSTKTIAPYVSLRYYVNETFTSNYATNDYKAHAAYINSDTYIVVTIPVRAGFKNAGTIDKIRIYFGGIESISSTQVGQLTIDYVYIGKLEDLPTPAYTVTFKDAAGKTLATQLVNKGEAATYTGATPTKAYDATLHYTFKGWDKALTNITANTTITATYTATAHSYTYSKVDASNHKAACTCGYSKSEGHSYTYKATTMPTTSAAGVLTGTCSKCSQTTTVTLPKLNTTDYTRTTTTAATCTATGVDKYTWKTTTYGSFSFNATTAALGHGYTTKVTAPTCTAQGYTTHTCSRCSHSYKDTYVAAKGHTEVIDEAVAATCTTAGKTEGKHCSVCKAVLVAQQTIPAKGHTEVIDKAVAATCTTAGKTEGKHCSVCKAVLVAQQTVPAKGHTEVIDKAVAATCTTSGKTEGKHCSVCDAVLVAQQTTPAKGHTEVIDKAVAATCTTSGKTEGKHCSVCNAILVAQQTVPAKGHTEVIDKAVAATCTTAGKTEGKHCSVCNAVLVAQQNIPAKGHTEVIDKAIAATCTTAGKTEGKHCSVCNAVLVAQQTIPAKG
ncbi:MAG: hypothetical protein J6K89_09050, partial [Oscillospiraceae bacterium]|nr:hypothetical protein [Oscillospiraceae bacterium]